jgi:hypothetical protein
VKLEDTLDHIAEMVGRIGQRNGENAPGISDLFLFSGRHLCIF